MGYSSYSRAAATEMRVAMNYAGATMDQLFVQNVKREIHQSMDPKKSSVRECLDSPQHPNSFPIILALDVTGSMGQIPLDLVKEGLPKLMGKITQDVPDAALLFLAIGDTTCDQYPLQVAQFESGDQELDTWLQRTYIEGGGGGNKGESYCLAWYYGAFHTQTDSWNKRGKKGLLFTVGDEPCIDLSRRDLKEITEMPHQADFTAAELLKKAQETYDVYHLHIIQGSAGVISLPYWKELLGDHCIVVDDYKKLPEVISEIVVAQNKGVETTKEEVL